MLIFRGNPSPTHPKHSQTISINRLMKGLPSMNTMNLKKQASTIEILMLTAVTKLLINTISLRRRLIREHINCNKKATMILLQNTPLEKAVCRTTQLIPKTKEKMLSERNCK